VGCSSCGAENRAGRKFCAECGAILALACPSCGAPNEPGEKFCGECGTLLADRSVPGVTLPRLAASPGPPPVVERRLVSVLFADLVGFTPFAEERDSEDVRAALTRYFDLASDVITRYGGTVEKFIGDAVMAVWGAPVAREDDAERAVRAGLELVDAVRRLGPAIQARAGVLTGEAAVTIGATNQGMVAGDLVNTAARLQSVAAAGTVLVGEATHRAARQAIAFEEAGEQLLKGKSAPVPAWRAIRVVAEVGGRNRSEALEAPFVGRDEEFRLLKDLFHATGREKRARLVSLMGPGGIGKTRLAWEFSKYTDGLVETTYWHVGRSPAYGEGITFWALGEMIRRRVGLAETDDEPTTRAKVAEALARWVPDAGERRWIESALLTLLGIEQGRDSEQLFGAWRTFFERLAVRGTVTLVFEDLHWADTGTLDFIDHLLEWSKNVPIYVLTLARPELVEKRPDWGAGKRNFISLHLEPLPEAAIRELLAGLVPGLPEPVVRAIVGRADGIPLYAVETVRMLVADGRLALRDGAYVPIGDLRTLAIPETLTALITSRLDALSAEDRALIQDAAVVGQRFTLAGLAAVSGIPEASLEPRLRALVHGELLEVDADPRSPERGQYGFVQALIRDVAYNTLARTDRKVRHLAAARFFEGLGTDELAGALAGHYLAAHANAPEGPEADALAAQAKLALEGAAIRAAALGSHEQAVAFLEQALTVASNPADEAELRARAGISAATAGHTGQADAFLRRALALHREGGNRLAASRVAAELGSILIDGRRLDDALAILPSAAAEFADLFPDPGVVALEGQLARAYFLHEEARRALDVIERVLDAAEHADLLDILADALVTKGSALGNLGRLHEGIGVIEIGEKIARTHGLTITLLRALNNHSAMVRDVDRREAAEAAREGLELARRIGSRPGMYSCLSAVGDYELFCLGDADAALATFESGLTDETDSGDLLQLLRGVFWIRAVRGEDVTAVLRDLDRVAATVTDPRFGGSPERALLALLDGHYPAAIELYRAAGTTIEQLGANRSEAARAALWAGNAAAAAEDLAALEATGLRTPVMDLRRVVIHAGLAALDGRIKDALAGYRDALRGWAALGVASEEAATGLDMAMLLDPAIPDVRAAADRARAVFGGMRATRLLERLDAALAGPTDATAPLRSPAVTSMPAV
jgi:class 3 adenylate cyclase/tetratricopeptide (TPR) repeat protein